MEVKSEAPALPVNQKDTEVSQLRVELRKERLHNELLNGNGRYSAERPKKTISEKSHFLPMMWF
ncbi:MAG: hypothetical protein EAZ15_01600 [Sphingobacteriales bacterium]|nr:MAG: hypothetical protein EAZ15_01600 [Sphingobacteriales bacterium]